jgi:hypothetical protein
MPNPTSVLLFLSVAVLSGAAGLLYYRRTVPPVSRRLRILLAALRACGLALACFLLLVPLLGIRRSRLVKPRTALVIDVSESMTLADGGRRRADLALRMLASDPFRRLLERTDCALFPFSDRASRLKAWNPDSVSFDGPATDMAAAFDAVRSTFGDEIPAGVVVVSDGVNTLGGDPVAASREMGCPVFTACAGVPVAASDAGVARVIAPGAAYADSTFEAEVAVAAEGFAGRQARVSVRSADGETQERLLALPPGGMESSVLFTVRTPAGEGVATFTASVEAFAGDRIPGNNRRAFAVRILKRRIRVLVAAGGPVPDVGFLRRAFGADRDLETEFRTLKDASGFFEGSFPDDAGLRGFDVLVLLDVPQPAFPEAAWKTAVRWIAGANRPFLLIAGPGVSTGRLAALGPRLPAFLRPAADAVQVTPLLTGEGKAHPACRITGDAGENQAAWERLPPVPSLGRIEPGAGCIVLVSGKPSPASASTAGAPVPLVAELRGGGGRAMAVFADGLFRWRLLPAGLGDPAAAAAEAFLRNTVRWLADSQPGKSVRFVSFDRVQRAGEEIPVFVEARDGLLRPIPSAEVKVRFIGPSNEPELPLSEAGSCMYSAVFRPVRSGDFRAVAEAFGEGRIVGADTAAFKVLPYAAELADPGVFGPGGPALLRAIAAATGGKVLDPETLAGIEDLSSLEPVRRVERREIDLLNRPLLLAIAILLFTVEWIIRKRAGMV